MVVVVGSFATLDWIFCCGCSCTVHVCISHVEEINMEPINIIIDTREQTPWAFDMSMCNVRIGTLKTGDYALDGDTGFAIERKSLDDFLGTISTGWERFQREIYRAKDAQFPAFPIIIEGSFSSCCYRADEMGNIVSPTHNHPKLTPGFITKRIAELTLMGCQVLFAEAPEFAAALALMIFRQRAESLNKEEVK